MGNTMEITELKKLIQPFLLSENELIELQVKINSSVEEWRLLTGFEDHYEVSNTGLIRRKKDKTIYIDGRVAYFSQTILKQSPNKKGYLRVYLSVGSKKYTKSVHRLVALTFIENPEKKATVNHKNCLKKINYTWNLEWNTNKENMNHAFDNGMYKERDKTTILNIKHMRKKLQK